MSTIAERVSAGIALLDEKVPDWRERVSVEDFDIRSTYNCILGQVFGGVDAGYHVGLERLGLEKCSCCYEENTVASCGFDVDFGDDMDFAMQFTLLQDEWTWRLQA